MSKITIFTPAYNRAHTLKRCYDSLLKQGYNDFEWLVIDDGSTDNTKQIMLEIINENKISINYIRQENQGKQAAWNKAVINATGYFFCGLDSDDSLVEGALAKVAEYFDELRANDELIGLRCLAVSSVTQKPDGKMIADRPIISSWFDEFSHSAYFGERIDVFKTTLLKSFFYPVKEDIKFIPEIWFYTRISTQNYKFLYLPIQLRLFFDEAAENRLSRSSLKTHAQGHYISRSCMLKNIPFKVWLKNPIAWFKTVVRFSQTCGYRRTPLISRIKDTNIIYALLSYFISTFVY
jgi:glycosyltransferase involved in cell wall biosynthesis